MKTNMSYFGFITSFKAFQLISEGSKSRELSPDLLLPAADDNRVPDTTRKIFKLKDFRDN